MQTHNYPTPELPFAAVFLVDHNDRLREKYLAEVEVHNHSFGEYPMTGKIRNPLKWPKFVRYFIKTLLSVRHEVRGADMVIGHWWIPSGVLSVLFGNNVRVVCHGTDLYWLRDHRFFAWLLRPAARRVAGWQCVSNDLRRVLRSLYPFIDESAITVEPMPVSSVFRSLEGAERDPALVVSVGSLIPRKGFDRLIRAAAELPSVKLSVYGDGPLRDQLQALIDELGVADRVTLHGAVSREELCRVFNRASLFALVSDNEGFGMVLKEAQACGCPTMAFTGDGMVDTGIDFPLERTNSISAKIREILCEGSVSVSGSKSYCLG